MKQMDYLQWAAAGMAVPFLGNRQTFLWRSVLKLQVGKTFYPFAARSERAPESVFDNEIHPGAWHNN